MNIVMKMKKTKKTKQKLDKILQKRFEQALAELPVMTVQKYEEWLKERVSERFINIFEEELKLKEQ